jgi:hypothetical protein
MQGQAPMKERCLTWQITKDGEYFACTECSWTFPNPKKLTEKEHNLVGVQRGFAEHGCAQKLPLKKFNW